MGNNVKAYKIVGIDGRWSIVLSNDSDEYSAVELYLKENDISEDKIDRIEHMELKEKIPNVYNGKQATLAEMAKNVAFFPRCILESDDLLETTEG